MEKINEVSSEIPGMTHYFKLNWTLPKADFDEEIDEFEAYYHIESLQKKMFLLDGIRGLNFSLNLEIRDCIYLVRLNSVQDDVNVFSRNIHLEYAYIASEAGVYDLTWWPPQFPHDGRHQVLSLHQFRQDYRSHEDTITIHCRVRARSEVFSQVEDTENGGVKYKCSVLRKFPEICQDKKITDYLLSGKIPPLDVDTAIELLKWRDSAEIDFLKTLSVNYLLKNLDAFKVLEVLDCAVECDIPCLTLACIEMLRNCNISRDPGTSTDSTFKKKKVPLPVKFY